jgi:hypothetical protein
MRSRLLPIAVGAIAAAVILGASAGGSPPAAKKHRKPTNLETSKDLWATINVCDTEDKPNQNTIGIRGSMPGLGDHGSRMFMRFQVQYKAKTDGKWHNAENPSATDSGYKFVGRSRAQVFEAGQDFRFDPPTDGGSHLLRGSVRFRWKHKGEIVARARRFTEPGHKTTAGADPAGYSAAECEITAP